MEKYTPIPALKTKQILIHIKTKILSNTAMYDVPQHKNQVSNCAQGFQSRDEFVGDFL